MNNFKNNIDKMVTRILNEEIESKVKELSKTINEGEWTEIEIDEELKGNQKKIDVAKPKGKITAADFKKLRDGKSFRAKTSKNMEEAETEEGNAFTGALANAKKHDKDSFEVDGKKFNVKEGDDFMDDLENDEKYGKDEDTKGYIINKITPYDVTLMNGKQFSNVKFININSFITPDGAYYMDQNIRSVDRSDGTEYNRKKVRENVNSLKLTEEELIDMIESIVMEEKVKDKDEKGNIANKEPQGLKDTNKVLNKNKQVNDAHTKEVVKKMKDYMKDMVLGGKGYEENPDDFPQSNYDMEKDHKEKKYNPSDAVEEYIEAFAYPGMTNLVYDEIKPDEEMITKQIKGDSKNGNAVTSKGKALGNVSKRSEKTGDRFKKNFDENLYGAEQQKGSYKRQTQPVDVAGDKKQSGSLRKNSIGKAEKIMNQLESTENKKSKIIAEEMGKMKNLIGYNRKTQ
jgi:hypothetical protein